MVLGELFLEALSSGVITQPEIDTPVFGSEQVGKHSHCPLFRGRLHVCRL